jgi:adenylyltransferase/sulfurtransferase
VRDTEQSERPLRADDPKRVLVIGAGGIAAPAALALAASDRADSLELVVVDDDVVEASNLHRQILFEDADLGRSKLDALRDALAARSPALRVRTVEGRFLPDSAARLLDGADVVLDACDNFATRFLAADAARLAGVAVVHAAAVRWNATVLAVRSGGRPCYRCLFEDLPAGDAPDCATAGVFGPVCGVAGAIAADLVLRILFGGAEPFGRVHTYDGARDRLRAVAFAPRSDCALCGDGASIAAIEPARYEVSCDVS